MTENNTAETVVYEKGSWQGRLVESSNLLDRSTKARKRAGALLWDGAQNGITEWLPNSDDDVSAENFSATLLSILGTSRKGDVSKIKTVALAVKSKGLAMGDFDNLGKAYAEAIRLTKTEKAEKEEDDAAEQAIEAIDAPKSASTPEAAAKVLLSKGVDGAVVAILDALGVGNEAAHRAFMRAVSTEVTARVQATKKAEADAKAAEVAKTRAEAKAKREAEAAEKAKNAPAKTKAEPKAASTKAKPAKASATTAKAKPAKAADKGEPVTEPVDAGTETTEPAAKAKPVVKGKGRAIPVRH